MRKSTGTGDRISGCGVDFAGGLEEQFGKREAVVLVPTAEAADDACFPEDSWLVDAVSGWAIEPCGSRVDDRDVEVRNSGLGRNWRSYEIVVAGIPNDCSGPHRSAGFLVKLNSDKNDITE